MVKTISFELGDASSNLAGAFLVNEGKNKAIARPHKTKTSKL